MNIKKLASAAVLLGASVTVHAGMVVGGTTIFDNSGLTQIENWLGEGELTLTNIFTKATGTTSFDFHNAVDGKGRTFTLMNASRDEGATWKTIGGYNPISWDSSNGYHDGLGAFIFNLTDSVIKTQAGSDVGSYQTYNTASYGPTFGGGHDIYVDSNLSNGYSFGYTYGNGPDNYGVQILGGSNNDSIYMQIGALEIFTIGEYASNAVPEPTTLALLGLGLLSFAASRRKSAKSKNA